MTIEVKNNLDASNEKSYWQQLAMNLEIAWEEGVILNPLKFITSCTPEHSNI